MKLTLILLCAVVLCGCAGGPTHDYYNAAVVGAKFKGPVTSTLVNDVQDERARLIRDGYKVIGTTRDYILDKPET